MFGLIADLISSITTVLLPIYASYKALRTSDPAQLTPWLIYWVVISALMLVESWTVFIIGWLPFYSWIRLVFLSYLVLPQTQGAKMLYYTYIEPFIVDHEHQIDLFIGQSHAKLSAVGLGYLNTLVDIIVERVLGRSPTSKGTPPPATTAGYAQNLFSRFTIPSARPGVASAPAPNSDFYGMLSGAVAAATSASSNIPGMGGNGRSRGIQADTPSGSGSLYPSNMNLSQSEKAKYIGAQRDKLGVLMGALDKEEQSLNLAYGEAPNLRERQNKSTDSFESIEHSHAHNGSKTTHGQDTSRRSTSGNWMPSGWWPSGGNEAEEKDAGSSAWNAAREVTDAVQGMSSGVEPGR